MRLKKGWHDYELAFGEIGGAARLSLESDPALQFVGPDAKKPSDDSLPSYERFDNASLEGWRPVAKDAFILHHELRPAVWQVTVGFSNTSETRGVCIGAESKTMKSNIVLPRHEPHEETFEVEVRDGVLDLTFWNEPSAFNAIGLSSLQVKLVRELK